MYSYVSILRFKLLPEIKKGQFSYEDVQYFPQRADQGNWMLNQQLR